MITAQQDEFEAKAIKLWRYLGGPEFDLKPQDWPDEWGAIADALRAEHTRGQIEALEGLLKTVHLDDYDEDCIRTRLAELRKGGT